MDCEKAQYLLSGYADGLIGEDDRKGLVAHLGSCSGCAGEARFLIALKDAFRSAPKYSAPGGFASGVMERIRDEGLDIRGEGAFGWFRAMPLRLKFAEAAAAAFVMALGIYSAGVLSDNLFSSGAENAALEQSDPSLVASVQPEDLGPVPPVSLGDIYLSIKENGNGQ
ncbi:MAG: zf-HC2 domain-containing protein [Deltaproteobacteria bacterium]|nr:zf-HC2 domain-containing protein [Deltaproteobacteria bacterium]MBZ0218859.1 zf-HC2 domain-containing protein [Deltaproteobacteria bacterium]